MADDIRWVRTDVLLAVHERMLAEHGGAHGVRDHGLLEAALARPQQLSAYQPQTSIVELAAAYVMALVRNHPFVDGNKRAAFMACYIFLELNGHRLCAPEPDAAAAVIALAAGDLSEAEFTAWLNQHCQERRRD